MKGFVRILETIIACIIILTALAFFFSIGIKGSDWQGTYLELRSQDLVAVGTKTGSIQNFVKTNDYSGLRSYLENGLEKSNDFSVEIIGIPNNIIYVGCNCTTPEINDIVTRISPLSFTYKGRPIEIRIDRVAASSLPDETNILLFANFATFSNEYNTVAGKNSIEKFLENGGSVFLVSDLRKENVESPEIRNIFNLTWTVDNVNGIGRFIYYNDPDKISYHISKYYENLTGHSPVGEMLNQFDASSGTINQIVTDFRSVIESANNKGSLIKCNKNVINGNGRAVWIAENNKSPEINNLTRAAILWASGERYKLDGPVKKIAPQVSRRVSAIVYESDTYEFWLTVWNIF